VSKNTFTSAFIPDIVMTLDEFEDEVHEIIERILNRLQSANLLTTQSASQAQVEILQSGDLVVELGHLIEDFIEQRRSNTN
jgi:hypothetical protein